MALNKLLFPPELEAIQMNQFLTLIHLTALQTAFPWFQFYCFSVFVVWSFALFQPLNVSY